MAHRILCDLMAPIFQPQLLLRVSFLPFPEHTYMDSDRSNKFALSTLHILSHLSTCHFFSSICPHAILKLLFVPFTGNVTYLFPANFVMYIILCNLCIILISVCYKWIKCLSNIVSLPQIKCSIIS